MLFGLLFRDNLLQAFPHLPRVAQQMLAPLERAHGDAGRIEPLPMLVPAVRMVRHANTVDGRPVGQVALGTQPEDNGLARLRSALIPRALCPDVCSSWSDL